MKHVRAAAGNVLDADAYVDLLPTLAGALPPGARAFAADPDHYNFFSRRCVKDLAPDTLEHGDDWLRLGFRHNCWKHDEDLSIRYAGVISLDQSDWAGLGTVTLDEVLPHDHGCSHEIAFLAGSLTVVCRDLTAKWTEADCPSSSSSGPGRPGCGGPTP